jgi:hypothetical protein
MNTETITLPIHYTIDENGNKLFDLDLIREEFEELLETLES